MPARGENGRGAPGYVARRLAAPRSVLPRTPAQSDGREAGSRATAFDRVAGIRHAIAAATIRCRGKARLAGRADDWSRPSGRPIITRHWFGDELPRGMVGAASGTLRAAKPGCARLLIGQQAEKLGNLGGGDLQGAGSPILISILLVPGTSAGLSGPKSQIRCSRARSSARCQSTSRSALTWM